MTIVKFFLELCVTIILQSDNGILSHHAIHAIQGAWQGFFIVQLND
ncbi:MAG: hypothetical protein JNK42_03130 [Caedimonas sp.]|nr:hypothetical protein [Caedimonas sp.]